MNHSHMLLPRADRTVQRLRPGFQDRARNWIGVGFGVGFGVGLLLSGRLSAQSAPERSLTAWLPDVQWKAPALPVQFRCGGSGSADFLRRCQVTQEQLAAT